jgi:PKD repeat protein
VGVLTASGESVGRTNVSIGVRELTNSSDVPYPIRTYPFGTRPPWDGELLVTEGSPSPTINTSDPEVGIPIEFDGSDVVTFDPVEIQWDFGDGTGATGSLVVEHTYAKPGNYTVTLTAVNADGLVESGQVVLSVAPASDETGSDAETTVDVILDGAPDGLRQYRVFLASTVDAPVTSIEPRLVGGQEFEVESGGVDSAGVTARATEVTSDTGTFTGRRALFSATFAGDHTRGAFALEVTDLVDDTGSPMSPGRVSLVVGDEVFSEPIPGTGGSTPTDTDGDGTYDDVDGNGVTDFGDVIALAFADTTALSDAQRDAVDFDSSGTYDFGDVITLAFAL